MDSSNYKDLSTAGLLRHRELLRSENLALQQVVHIKAQRLQHIIEENQHLYAHLRQLIVRGNHLLQEVRSLGILADSPE